MKVSQRIGVILIAGITVIGGAELGERLSVPGFHRASSKMKCNTQT